MEIDFVWLYILDLWVASLISWYVYMNEEVTSSFLSLLLFAVPGSIWEIQDKLSNNNNNSVMGYSHEHYSNCGPGVIPKTI